jgi:hypothetical protein
VSGESADGYARPPYRGFGKVHIHICEDRINGRKEAGRTRGERVRWDIVAQSGWLQLGAATIALSRRTRRVGERERERSTGSFCVSIHQVARGLVSREGFVESGMLLPQAVSHVGCQSPGMRPRRCPAAFVSTESAIAVAIFDSLEISSLCPGRMRQAKHGEMTVLPRSAAGNGIIQRLRAAYCCQPYSNAPGMELWFDTKANWYCTAVVVGPGKQFAGGLACRPRLASRATLEHPGWPDGRSDAGGVLEALVTYRAHGMDSRMPSLRRARQLRAYAVGVHDGISSSPGYPTP